MDTPENQPAGAAPGRPPTRSEYFMLLGIVGATAIVGIVGIVIIVAVVAYRAAGLPPPTEAPPTPPASAPVETPAANPPAETPLPPVRTGSERPRQEAARMLEYAREYRQQHPEDFTGVLNLLAKARMVGVGTATQPAIEEEIAAVHELRQTWADARWAEVAARAREQLVAGNFDGAMKLSRRCDPAWQPFVADAQRVLQQEIAKRGDRVVAELMDTATRYVAEGDLIGAEGMLDDLAQVPWRIGVGAVAARVDALRADIATRRQTATRREMIWEAAKEELLILFLKRDVEACAARLQQLTRAGAGDDDERVALRNLVEAYRIFDEHLVGTVKQHVGERVDLSLAGEARRIGTLVRVDPDPAGGKPILMFRIQLVIDGITGTTSQKIPLDEMPPGIIAAWTSQWQPRTVADHCMMLLNAISRQDLAEAKRALAAVPAHPLLDLAEQRIRDLEIGSQEAAAEQSWNELRRRLEGELTPQRAANLMTILHAWREAHGETQFFKAIAEDYARVQRQLIDVQTTP